MSNPSDFIIENGVLTKYVGPGGDVVIPEGVTSIGIQAFSYCESLTNVVIPAGVTRIGYAAFSGCRALESVTIPDGVTSIGYLAFSYCSALESVTIPEGVTEIGKAVFSGCSRLAKLVLPESLGSIAKYLIWKGSSTDISIPDISRLPASLRINALRCFMKDGAPKDDPRFESHCKYIKANAAKLVEQAIKDKRLLSLMCAEKLITPKNAALYVEAAQQTGDAEAITMMLDYQANKISAKQKESLEKRKEKEQDTITERMAARRGKAGVEGLNIAVTGKLETFEKRDDLKKLLIEKGAKLASGLSAKVDYLIMNDPQSDSAKAKKAQELGIEVLTEREFNEKIDRIFVIKKHELIAYYGNGGDVTIPAGVTSIGDLAFFRCSNLRSVVIPEGVTSIGDLAFWCCHSLASVTIPESVTCIGNGAFQDCGALTSVKIPEGVTSIGDNAFLGCESLTSVTIPESVTSIGDRAFRGCRALANPDGFVIVNGILFDYVGAGEDVRIPEGVTSIGDRAFFGCESIERVAIPASVTSIEKEAFGAMWQHQNLTICAPAGSHAEQYAKEHGIPFEAE